MSAFIPKHHTLCCSSELELVSLVLKQQVVEAAGQLCLGQHFSFMLEQWHVSIYADDEVTGLSCAEGTCQKMKW